MTSTQRPPNIVFVFSDQQRWDTAGCYGQSLPVTPHLDRMASEGVRFASAFTNQPVCGPTRAVLQTGRYATETGCWRNDIALPLDERTFAHELSYAGYEVGYIGKWHLASGPGAPFHTSAIPPERRGGWKDQWLAADVLEFTSHGYDGHLFDGGMRRVDFTGYRADALSDFAVDHLRTRDLRRPFCLFVSYIEPHHQNDRERYEGPDGSKERWRGFTPPGDLVGTAGDWRESYPDYLGCCHAVDAGLGRIRAELDRRGITGETLVVYTSDHGSHFRTRNAEYKRSCHDASIRIPLVVSGPGFPRGEVASGLASLIDLPPTVLCAAGVAIPERMRGRALQDLAAGGGGWDEVFIQISESQIGRALRTPRWTYAVCAPGRDGWLAGAADTYVEDFLYDLEADPHQRANLVADPRHAAVRAELAQRLAARMQAAGELRPAISSAIAASSPAHT